MDPQGRMGDRIIRRPRVREVLPEVVKSTRTRRPARHFTPPYMLFYSFGVLIMLGALFLALPIANSKEDFTPLDVAFFTSTSAVTVTGHTVVNTADYWSSFGHAVIFILMMVGGLGFTTLATFFLIVIGQRITLPERMLMRDTMGVDRMGGLVAVMRNIVLIVLGIYVVGMLTLWWRLQGQEVIPGGGPLSGGEALWQSAFLSVSAFNSAGFSILPESSSLEMFHTHTLLLGFLAILIVLGGISWTVLVDVFRQRRFSRLSLDTKMVVTTSIFLWVLGALVLFIAEYRESLAASSVVEKVYQSVFHSISGRTAGLATLDFSASTELTRLFYPFLMFVGGAAGSVAGGIKVATLAVIIAAVISSIRGRPQTEAFGREIPHFQVHRAVSVAVLGVAFIFLVSLALTFTEKDIDFLDLLFDTVSAFGTTGLSTGVPPQLSLVGEILFMITMFAGRLGPLTMALALAPREEASVYRFVQERVKIG